MSSGEPALHFGLGEHAVAEVVSVYWPSGHSQRFAAVAAQQRVRITEPTGSPPVVEDSVQPPLFTEVGEQRGLEALRFERPFDDFEHQPLLPARLSRAGPGLALGDADGDGDDDLWVGGSRGVPGQLYSNQRGQLRPLPRGPWVDDAGCEDGPALWLDVDADGDQDLYVASASVEHAQGSPFLRDRLYLNGGGGQFTRAPFDRLPNVGDSTGAVVAADFDADGDLDLFVGARSVPRRYPLTPTSRLLVNTEGRFEDRTSQLAPHLASVGMVTGALWSDADGDGDPDLLVTCEWGPVKYWQNEGGRLVDRTAEAGLSEGFGWWRGIAGCDLDGDGDVDYAVTNAGWNTKYAASAEHPALLLFGRFGGEEEERLLEVKHTGDGDLPVRGLSCSSSAMPFVLDIMPTFHAFAAARLDEIYAPERIAGALDWKATELASGVFWNEGPGDNAPVLRFEALPRLVQVAAGSGVHCGDVTGDGWADIVIVQNDFSREPETGRWDGGLGVLLEGGPGRRFTSRGLAQSGLVVPGDATALVLGDLDQDGRPELCVGRNGARPLLFQPATVSKERPLLVRLVGPAGNPTALGGPSRIQPARAAHADRRDVRGAAGTRVSPAPSSASAAAAAAARCECVGRMDAWPNRSCRTASRVWSWSRRVWPWSRRAGWTPASARVNFSPPPMIIAIDGPAASGKSTVARRLAASLQLLFLNTGAMYRAVGAECVKRGLDLDDAEACGAVAEDLAPRMNYDEAGSLTINDESWSARIDREEAAGSASAVARHTQVRAPLVVRQRQIGEVRGAVAEGRDTTTVVFPKADYKFFLWATAAVRGERRARQEGASREGCRVRSGARAP